MTTGAEHYRTAEDLLRSPGLDPQGVAEAQVHALLALTEAYVAAAVLRPEDRDGWDRAAGRLPRAAEDTRRLDRIRVVLAKFDWEHDDRQYALERIEMIADGGQP